MDGDGDGDGETDRGTNIVERNRQVGDSSASFWDSGEMPREEEKEEEEEEDLERRHRCSLQTKEKMLQANRHKKMQQKMDREVRLVSVM